jgi:hypothetical protein
MMYIRDISCACPYNQNKHQPDEHAVHCTFFFKRLRAAAARLLSRALEAETVMIRSSARPAWPVAAAHVPLSLNRAGLVTGADLPLFKSGAAEAGAAA